MGKGQRKGWKKAERRMVPTVLTKTTPNVLLVPPKKKLDIATLVSCLGVAVSMILFIVFHGYWTIVLCLIVLFLSLVWPCIHIVEWRTNKSWAQSKLVIAISLLVVLGGVVAFGILVWPPPRRHMLSEKEKAAFEEPLKAQVSLRDGLQLACPQADESACIYASQFVNLFRDAGWKVKGNTVDRVVLATPSSGVILYERGTGKLDPDNWRSGLWVKMSASLVNVRQAFVNIGIEPDSMAALDLQDGAMTVYFGSEKQNESEKTGLTHAIDVMNSEIRKGHVTKPR